MGIFQISLKGWMSLKENMSRDLMSSRGTVIRGLMNLADPC